MTSESSENGDGVSTLNEACDPSSERFDGTQTSCYTTGANVSLAPTSPSEQEAPITDHSTAEQPSTNESDSTKSSGYIASTSANIDNSTAEQPATNESDTAKSSEHASTSADTDHRIAEQPATNESESSKSSVCIASDSSKSSGYIASTSVDLAPSPFVEEQSKSYFIGEENEPQDRNRAASVEDFLTFEGPWTTAVDDPPAVSSLAQLGSISSIEARNLLYLHTQEANCKDRKTSAFTASFCNLFTSLPSADVGHIRAILDACLVFRPDGRAADLRNMVFEEISKDEQIRVLDKIQASCKPPSPDTRGFVLLSDVDDTLFPASDALRIGGSDRSWHLDGRFYPGVSRLHRELRADLRESYGGDYSVLLTARPPFLVKSTTTKTTRLSGLSNPRLAILPGTGNNMQVAQNIFKILAGKFSQLGQVKVMRFLEYAALFPEYAGRFVFIGDDGQGDFDAAVDMLSLREDSLANSRRAAFNFRTPRTLLAFVAVHAVQQKQGTTVSEEVRAQRIAAVRKKNPPIASDKSVLPGTGGATRHRFFYFDDYMDLAEQLTAAGWLEPEQGNAVMQAFIVDNTPDPLQEAMHCNYLALRAALRCREATLHEADEVEKESFKKAKALLPAIEQAHVRLAPVPPECTALAFEVQLDGLVVRNEKDIAGPGQPSCVFQNIQDKGFARWQWEADSRGFISLPWPCDSLCHTAARGVIDIGNTLRCYIVLDRESSDGLRNGDSVEVLLLSQSDANAEKPLGRVTIKVFWVGMKQEPMKVEDFFPEAEALK